MDQITAHGFLGDVSACLWVCAILVLRMTRTSVTERSTKARLALLGVCLSMWSMPAFVERALANPLGAPEKNRLSSYHLQKWGLQDGLPQNTVTSLLQDRRGYLWVGTFGGLVRFDGFEFELFALPSGFVSPRVLSLAQDDGGCIWIGYQQADKVSRICSGATHLEPIFLPEGLRKRNIGRLAFGAGALWASGGGAVASFDGAVWATSRVDPRVRQLAVTASGEVWVGGPRLLGKVTTSTLGVTEVDTSVVVHQMAADPEGRVWLAHESGLSVLLDGQPEPRLTTAKTHWRITPPIFGQDGTLWITVEGTLYRHPSYQELATSRDLSRNLGVVEHFPLAGPARALIEDRDQNLWVGLEGGGLIRLSRLPFAKIDRRNGLIAPAVGPVVSDGAHGLLVGNACEGIAHIVDGKIQDYILGGLCVRAILKTSKGILLAGAGALHSFKQGAATSILATPPGCGGVTALLESRAGKIFGGTERGCLFELESNRLRSLDAPLDSSIGFLSESPSGDLWIGEHSRVAIYHVDGHFTLLSTKEGAPTGDVRALHLDGDDVWLGSYGGGLALLRDGRTYRFGKNEGLPDLFISHIVDDGRGFLWLNTNRGAVRIPKRDFDLVIDGERDRARARLLSTGEGEIGQPSGHFDGRILSLPTIEGLARIDLDRLEERPPPLPTWIEGARLDESALDIKGENEIPPGPGTLEVEYTSPLLRWPHLGSFEHRLFGYEEAWRRTRQRVARYERLPPGNYEFVVRTVDEEGRESPSARVRFVLSPHLYQTTWFRTGAGASLALLLLGGHRWRTRAISRHNRRLEQEMRHRQVAEKALEERETHYRRVFESSVNAFVLEDSEGRIVDLNPAACEMLGGARSALLGRATRTFFGPRIPSSNPECVTFLRLDGTSFEGKLTRRRMESGERSSQVLLTIVDLSPMLEAQAQERRLQAQLAHSQRVEAIGRLAGGVAHDVNNMLTVVKGQARLALECLAEEDFSGVEESLNDILQSSERTGNITRQLLALGRRRQVQPQEIDAKARLLDMRRMLERLTPDNVVLRWAFTEEPCGLRVDPTQFEQLVVNLVLNAVQALPRGGTVELGLTRARGEPAHLPQGALQGEEWINLSVEDDGVGMSDETKARIFEPFFSTKPPGESTGLGLSVVHGIIVDAGGRYYVESTEGLGTRFDILFPALAATPSTVSDGSARAEVGGSERILFCEDEAPVRRTTARVLERAGYRVTVASHPFEALERVRNAETPYDLLVTDVMMPEMNGRELAAAVRRLVPGAKILFVSGYTSDIIENLDERQEFIEKPYEAHELLAAVRRLLDAPSPVAS